MPVVNLPYAQYFFARPHYTRYFEEINVFGAERYDTGVYQSSFCAVVSTVAIQVFYCLVYRIFTTDDV